MKIAVALYGQPRHYQKGYENIMKFLQEQGYSTNSIDVDFFYHCWTLNPNEQFSCSPFRNIDANVLTYKEHTAEIIKTLYKPVGYLYENQSQITIDENIYKDTLAYNNTSGGIGKTPKQINNTLFQMYSIFKVRDLIHKHVQKTNTQYKCVIITRFDIDIIPQININKLDLAKIYLPNDHFPRKIITNTFMIMPIPVFLKWFDNYNNLNCILNDNELDKCFRHNGEGLAINGEELITATYIYHFKTFNEIVRLSGRFAMI